MTDYKASKRIVGTSDQRVGLGATKGFSFSSLDNWVNGNSTYFYLQNNSLYVNSSTNDTQTNITYDLNANDSITVASSFVLQFKCNILEYSATTSAGSQHRIYVGLSAGTNAGEPATQDEVMTDLEARSDQQNIGAYNYDGSTQTYSSSDNYSLGVYTRWIRLIRNANTSFTVEIYDNAEYSGTPLASPTANANLSGVTGLQYLTVRIWNQSNSGTLNIELSDMQFYNNTTTATNPNIQTNSIWEESDTGKHYIWSGSVWTEVA